MTPADRMHVCPPFLGGMNGTATNAVSFAAALLSEGCVGRGGSSCRRDGLDNSPINNTLSVQAAAFRPRTAGCWSVVVACCWISERWHLLQSEGFMVTADVEPTPKHGRHHEPFALQPARSLCFQAH
jgi:hypothetical protein